MVAPVCYPKDGRPYSRIGPLFPGNFVERHLQQYPSPIISQELRAPAKNMAEREPDSESMPQRKRIAVACGRCRKRKIRCSGDPGNGMPCHNCKNAGAELCQFLRVASQEAPIIPERGFSFDIDSARACPVRSGVSSPFLTPYAPEVSDGFARIPSSAAYSYASRCHQTIPSWATSYPDDSVDYSPLHYSPAYLNSDASTLYRALKAPSNGHLYGDTDTTYNCVARSTENGDSPNLSVSTIAAALPTTMSSSDRVLPTPVNRFMLGQGQVASSYYRSDVPSLACSSRTSPQSDSSNPSSAVSDIFSGYASYDNHHSIYGTTSGVPSLGSGHRVSTPTSCGTDVFSSSSGVGSLFADSIASLRSPGSSGELSYKYSSSSTDRGGSGALTSTLSNGRPYTVPEPPSTSSAAYEHSHHHYSSHYHHDHHSHVGVALSSYLMSGGNESAGATDAVGELSRATADAGGAATARGCSSGGGGGGDDTGHAEVHRRAPAGGLTAA